MHSIPAAKVEIFGGKWWELEKGRNCFWLGVRGFLHALFSMLRIKGKYLQAYLNESAAN